MEGAARWGTDESSLVPRRKPLYPFFRAEALCETVGHAEHRSGKKPCAPESDRRFLLSPSQ